MKDKRLRKILEWKYLPLVLSLQLYCLIYFIRWQQGGLDLEINLFTEERQFLDEQIKKFLPSPHSQLLSGIILGNKEDLPGPLKLSLRDTSTLHMVVVSGQNLSILAGLIIRLSGILTRKIAIGLSFSLILGYILLTGAQIPVLRAGIMVTLAYLAQILGKEALGWWVLLLTGGFLLLVNPNWVFDLSFQLSFLATVGVVVVAPILSSKLTRLPIFLRENLGVTIGAQIMVLPIIASNFHQISLVAVPANLLVSWAVPYIMSGGLFLIGVSFISELGAEIAAFFVMLLLSYFIWVVSFFASLPFAWEYVGDLQWLVWIGYYILVIALLMGLTNRKI